MPLHICVQRGDEVSEVETHHYRKARRITMVALLLLLLIVALFLVGMIIGSVYIPPGALLNPTGPQREILSLIRLPEAVGAIIIGIDLAFAGAVMQSIFRNPLADPYITGTASGAVLGTVGGIYVGAFISQLRNLTIFLQPLLGFMGSLAATALVIILGRRRFWLTLILAGIAVSIFLSALVTIAESYLLISSPSSFSIFLLLFGSLGSLNWDYDIIIIASSLPVLIFLALSARKLNVVMMGDELAQSTGINAGSFRAAMLLGAALLTSVSLSFTGMIGFVGLIAPHIARLLLRDSDNAVVLPVCGLVGAALLLLANSLSKALIPETVIPITAVTSLIGAPLLIYLVKRGGYSGKA